MQIQAVNKHAVNRYNEFVHAISAVEVAMSILESLLKKASDTHRKFRLAGSLTKDELTVMHTKAMEELWLLKSAARRYAAELQSRGWRV